ncbi:putative monooxygenase [Pseudozyma hubeiensis SY62]|uniref:Putative monooxygenase n=1 Tax=Pseudozyma hubeiensis (strain SY62) TaxID=1305764 RepID=R9P2N4_PSEHS|nr:putative monooxygenase [Pseudozyma hubeiensis SY62]GAC95534.1 putative monooxygenase [Pseudozyma hubeiensis SY62]
MTTDPTPKLHAVVQLEDRREFDPDVRSALMGMVSAMRRRKGSQSRKIEPQLERIAILHSTFQSTIHRFPT